MTAILLWQVEAVEARLIRPTACFIEQGLPFWSWQTLVVPICTRVFTAVIKEALVVVLCLERLDLLLYERINLIEVPDSFSKYLREILR